MNIDELANCEKSKQDRKYYIKNDFIRDWMKKLKDSHYHPIQRTNKTYNDEFKCEEYLDLVQNPKYRIILSKFRTSSPTLAIKSGRHTNSITPLEKRICGTCNEITTTFTFLLTAKCSQTSVIYCSEKLMGKAQTTRTLTHLLNLLTF